MSLSNLMEFEKEDIMNKNILDLGEFLKQKGEDDKRIQVIVSDELK